MDGNAGVAERPKAADSRSALAGVPRFKSWPRHRPILPPPRLLTRRQEASTGRAVPGRAPCRLPRKSSTVGAQFSAGEPQPVEQIRLDPGPANLGPAHARVSCRNDSGSHDALPQIAGHELRRDGGATSRRPRGLGPHRLWNPVDAAREGIDLRSGPTVNPLRVVFRGWDHPILLDELRSGASPGGLVDPLREGERTEPHCAGLPKVGIVWGRGVRPAESRAAGSGRTIGHQPRSEASRSRGPSLTRRSHR